MYSFVSSVFRKQENGEIKAFYLLQISYVMSSFHQLRKTNNTNLVGFKLATS
jgi:hypothetical protein